jgi:hypothetical protein
MARCLILIFGFFLFVFYRSVVLFSWFFFIFGVFFAFGLFFYMISFFFVFFRCFFFCGLLFSSVWVDSLRVAATTSVVGNYPSDGGKHGNLIGWCIGQKLMYIQVKTGRVPGDPGGPQGNGTTAQAREAVHRQMSVRVSLELEDHHDQYKHLDNIFIAIRLGGAGMRTD